MQDGTQSALTIEALPEGGFLVMPGGHGGCVYAFHYAATSIEEALAFVRAKLKTGDK